MLSIYTIYICYTLNHNQRRLGASLHNQEKTSLNPPEQQVVTGKTYLQKKTWSRSRLQRVLICFDWLW